MRKTLIGAAMVGMLAGAAMVPMAQAAPPKVFWEGQSSEFRIRWTPNDLTARGKVNFSVRPIARARVVPFKAVNTGLGGCSYERRFRLLSVVGPYVSVHDVEYISCQGWARPDGAHRLTTIDLTRPAGAYNPTGKVLAVKDVAKLTDLFPEGEVLAALLRDPVLKPRIKGTPATIKALLENTEIDHSVDAHPCMYLGEDFLTRFAFHHLKGEKVAVRLAMSARPGPCRGMETELGLLLTVPPTLKGALALAQSRKQGFLMDKAPKGETLIEFRWK